MKKLLSGVFAITLVALSASSLLARSSYCGAVQAASYTVCSIQNCTLTGSHIHNNKTYAAHYYGDGHEYHNYCIIDDCNINGYHSHDDVYCFGYNHNNGLNYNMNRSHH